MNEQNNFIEIKEDQYRLIMHTISSTICKLYEMIDINKIEDATKELTSLRYTVSVIIDSLIDLDNAGSKEKDK